MQHRIAPCAICKPEWQPSSAETKLRSSKYLNNLTEQDHRGVKLRIGPMLGFKRFEAAAIDNFWH